MFPFWRETAARCGESWLLSAADGLCDPTWPGARVSAILPSGRVASVADAVRWHADVAQLVAHHLAKVRVAGSNPVVRSFTASLVLVCGGSGRLAQWERASLTRKRSLVQTQYRPLVTLEQAFRPSMAVYYS